METKRIRLAVRFPDRRRAIPAIGAWSCDPTVRIVRARLTPQEAWFELELAGNALRVDEVIRLSAGLGAALRPLPAGAA
jgi:hypothetical protein